MKRELLKIRCQTWEHEGKVIILSTRYRRARGIRMSTQKQTCKLHLYLLMMWTCGHVHSHTGLQVMQCTRHTNINVQHFFFSFFFCSHSSVAIVINTWESCKQAGWVTPGVRVCVCVCWRESCKWESVLNAGEQRSYHNTFLNDRKITNTKYKTDLWIPTMQVVSFPIILLGPSVGSCIHVYCVSALFYDYKIS